MAASDRAEIEAAEPHAERGSCPCPARVALGLLRPDVALAAAATVLAAVGVLLARLIPTSPRKPLFDDEGRRGLTAVHPFRELFDIVLFDRGGAPLHFALGQWPS